MMTLHADFDHGALDVDASRIEGDTVYLVGRTNYYTDRWKWLYFQMTGVKNRHLGFHIQQPFAGEPTGLDHHRMVFSYDQENWHFFDQGRFSETTGYQFGQNAPFTEDSVFIAYGLPYSMGRFTALMAELHTSPYIRPTSSADANLILGYSTGGVDDIGRTIPSHPLYGFQLTDFEGTTEKAQIVLMSGVHPNEPLAHHMLEGLLRFLIGPSAEAVALRERACFFVYPMVNPDGRFAGYNRSTVQHPDRDPNRCWHPEAYADMAEIRTFATALQHDLHRVDYFIDFHAWTHTTAPFAFVAKSENFHRDPFWLALQRRAPHLEHEDSSFENWSTETFAVKTLQAGFSSTFETMFVPHQTIADFQDLGRTVGLAFYEALCT